MAKTDSYLKRAQIIKAMAHPSRLAMLEAMADGEKCVCELQKRVGSDISTVSKHLSIMKTAGLVEVRRQGLWMHYRLRVPCILEFMKCIETAMNKKRGSTCRTRN